MLARSGSFASCTQHSEELSLTREELVANDWRVEVPARFGDRLDELGVEPADFIN